MFFPREESILKRRQLRKAVVVEMDMKAHHPFAASIPDHDRLPIQSGGLKMKVSKICSTYCTFLHLGRLVGVQRVAYNRASADGRRATHGSASQTLPHSPERIGRPLWPRTTVPCSSVSAIHSTRYKAWTNVQLPRSPFVVSAWDSLWRTARAMIDTDRPHMLKENSKYGRHDF